MYRGDWSIVALCVHLTSHTLACDAAVVMGYKCTLPSRTINLGSIMYISELEGHDGVMLGSVVWTDQFSHAPHSEEVRALWVIAAPKDRYNIKLSGTV